MEFSEFGERFARQSGTFQLMEDLGEAMAGDQQVLMLGGGNPAHIPEVQVFFQDRFQRLAENPAELAHVVGNYDPPQGNKHFIQALCDLIKHQFSWDIGPENIALTSGSQSSFFFLFNLLAGEFAGGGQKKILLPMTPEYIGYSDVGLTPELFVANRPDIKVLEDRLFKYHIDFDQVQINDSIGAVCVSRPTNPTGNVLTDHEIDHLLGLAGEHDIPLIIDNAYGMPFPKILFVDATLSWSKDTILCMSLSKLGLPGVRTGIVIARPEIITAIAKLNAIAQLAPGSVGPAIALDLVRSGEVLNLVKNVIQPYYKHKVEQAIQWFREELDGIDFYIHKAEGALFLWLWFPGLSITSNELYQRLKRRGVLVVSGHYFFPGLAEPDWRHQHECIRVTYAMQDSVVEQGIKHIAAEVKAVAAG